MRRHKSNLSLAFVEGEAKTVARPPKEYEAYKQAVKDDIWERLGKQPSLWNLFRQRLRCVLGSHKFFVQKDDIVGCDCCGKVWVIPRSRVRNWSI